MNDQHIFECECGVTSPAYSSPRHVARVKLAHVCAETCPACKYRRATSPRGLCKTCYMDPEVRVDYETKLWCADDMLDTWDELRREGYTTRLAAERMGVTVKALNSAICRGAHRGDPRARRLGSRVGAA